MKRKPGTGQILQLIDFTEVQNAAVLRTIGKVNRRRDGRTARCIYHRNANTVITRVPEVDAGALAHTTAAAVNVAVPAGSKSSGRNKAQGQRQTAQEGEKSFQMTSHSNHVKLKGRHIVVTALEIRI